MPQGPVDPEIIGRLTDLRTAAGRHEPFTVGALVGPTFVGTLDWDTGGPVLSGPPEKIAHVLGKFAAMGVDQVQIRLRSRSVEELVEQIELFGTGVLPLLEG